MAASYYEDFGLSRATDRPDGGLSPLQKPTTRPGGRVLHARLEDNGVPVPSLDLASDLSFALLTGPGGEAWRGPAVAVAAETGFPSASMSSAAGTVCADPCEWAALREVESTGCVLVRPDRHVAWRSARYTPDSAQQLPAVINQALGRQP